MRKYYNYFVKKALAVKKLITIEHMVLSSDFEYPAETHAFHEFIYVDSGQVTCHTNGKKTVLKQGDFFLILPNETHRTTTENHSATAFFICFGCTSEVSEIVRGRSTLDKEMRALVGKIVKEAKNAFRFPFEKKLVPLEKPTFGSQQLIENYVEELLIRLVRQKANENADICFVMNSLEFENGLVNDIIALLKENLYGHISLNEISEKTFYSKTYINNIFKKNLGFSIMQYYNRMKIQEAKKLLRENLSAATVSDLLQFESPNYFTKVFKKFTGLTPTQYKKTTLQ